MVLFPETAPVAEGYRRRVQQELSAESVPQTSNGTMLIPKMWNGVRLITSEASFSTTQILEETLRHIKPDYVLVSSEDFAQRLLQVAVTYEPRNTIYLAHTPQMFPFGPAAMLKSRSGAAAIQACRGVVGISRFTRRYFEDFLGLTTNVVYPPLTNPTCHSSDVVRRNGYVTMVNPCTVKGIDIFLELAACCPETSFAALPGWGTTTEDIVRLRGANVTVLTPCKDMDEVWCKTRVLVVPSLWTEGFGLVVVEAMLRGIPVLSSDQGGLSEAKLGTPYVFPVNPIRRYSASIDECGLPIAERSVQDVLPWVVALKELMSSDDVYTKMATNAKVVAEAFVSSIDRDGLERVLLDKLQNG